MTQADCFLLGSSILLTGVRCGGVPGSSPATPQTDQQSTSPVQPSWPADPAARASIQRSAEQAADLLAKTVIAILPVKDLPTFFAQSLHLPICPGLHVALALAPDGDLILTLDYADGCAPYPLPTLRLAGQVSGRVFPASLAFEFTTQNFRAADRPIEGTISGSVTAAGADGAHDFAVRIALNAPNVMTLRGNARLRFTDDPAALTIIDASLMAAPSSQSESLSITLSNVLVQPRDAGTCSPVSGTAAIAPAASDGSATAPDGTTTSPSLTIPFGPAIP